MLTGIKRNIVAILASGAIVAIILITNYYAQESAREKREADQREMEEIVRAHSPPELSSQAPIPPMSLASNGAQVTIHQESPLEFSGKLYGYQTMGLRRKPLEPWPIIPTTQESDEIDDWQPEPMNLD